MKLAEGLTAAPCPRRGQKIDPEELRRFVGQRLAAFKVPSHVEVFSDELPRNAAGKILKRQIRDDLAARR